MELKEFNGASIRLSSASTLEVGGLFFGGGAEIARTLDAGMIASAGMSSRDV